jgi:hypothetical protein
MHEQSAWWRDQGSLYPMDALASVSQQQCSFCTVINMPFPMVSFPCQKLHSTRLLKVAYTWLTQSQHAAGHEPLSQPPVSISGRLHAVYCSIADADLPCSCLAQVRMPRRLRGFQRPDLWDLQSEEDISHQLRSILKIRPLRSDQSGSPHTCMPRCQRSGQQYSGS